MSNNHSSRSLRLERLESRSLLAAGVFDFTFHADDSNRSAVDLDRSHPGMESKQDGRSGSDGRSDSRPNRDQHHRRDPHDRPRNRPEPINHLRLNELTQSSPIVGNPPSTTTNDRPVTQLASRNEVSTPINTFPTTRAPSIDAALASLTSTIAEDSSPSVAEVVETFGLPEPSAETLDEFRYEASRPQSIINPQTGSVDLPNSDDGFIELAPIRPLANDETNGNQPTATELEPWSLNRDIFPMLKRLLESTPGDRAEIADALIDDWFGDGSGMIALKRVVLPANPFVIDTLPIDVRLESTLMLGRTLELFASGATPALSGPVLDAIMASLQESAESASQPVAQASLLNSPTIAYPAAVIIPTTLAISNHRKHKFSTSNLQRTKPNAT